MLHADPFAEELLRSLNERIKNGDEYIKAHPKSQKSKATLLAMKKRRRFLNYIYIYQLSMLDRLSDPKQIIADITAMKRLYTLQNPEEYPIYRQQESRLCKASFSSDVADANPEDNSSDPVTELIEAYNIFDVGYDYENIDQFFLDAENLLRKTVRFTFAILDSFAPIPRAQKC